MEANIYRKEGACLGRYCSCPGYLAPEPPKPERKLYVVEMTDEQAGSWLTSHDGQASKIAKTPLDEYLAAHPTAAIKAHLRACHSEGAQ